MNSRKFNYAETTKLVELYRNHRNLWDRDHPQYTNREKRRLALNDITKRMNIENMGSVEILYKLRNLRTTYTQELKKIEDSRKSGSVMVYKPRLGWFDLAHEFLADRVLQTRRHSSDVVNLKTSFKSEDVAKEYNVVSLLDNIEHTPSKMEESYIIQPASFVNAAKETSDDDVLDEHLYNSTKEPSYFEDEFDLFAKYIALTIRNLPKEIGIETELKIHTVLSQSKLEALRKSKTSQPLIIE